jgi:hypothetical protein
MIVTNASQFPCEWSLSCGLRFEHQEYMDCAAGAVSQSRPPANVASNNGCVVEPYM